MPAFFFDCFDGERHFTDEQGVTLATEAEAREHAVVLAQSLLMDMPLEAEATLVTVTVRAQDGAPGYVAHASFTGCWTKDRAAVAPALD